MSFEAIVGIIFGVCALLILWFLVAKKAPKRLKAKHFNSQWKEIQKLCPNKDDWVQAIIEADELLDDALKIKRYKGGSMGERLVDAQKVFTENDNVWYAHKLRKKIEADPDMNLKKADVQDALFGIRQALKDLGAL